MTGGVATWTRGELAAHDGAVRASHDLIKNLADHFDAIRADFSKIRDQVEALTRTALQLKGAASKKKAHPSLEDLLKDLKGLTRDLADSTKRHTRDVGKAEAAVQCQRIKSVLDLLRNQGLHAGALAVIMVELYTKLDRLRELYAT